MGNALIQAIIRCTVLAKEASGKNPQRGREAASLMRLVKDTKQQLYAFLQQGKDSKGSEDMPDILAGFIAPAMMFLEPTNQVATAISAAVLAKNCTCSKRLGEEMDKAWSALASYATIQGAEDEVSGAYCILARLSLVNTLCELTALAGSAKEGERDAITIAWDRAAILLCSRLAGKGAASA